LEDKLMPTVLETILAEYPDALTSVEDLPEELPGDLLERYPDAQDALREIFDLAHRLKDTLTPVKPRDEFVRELKLVLVEQPAAEDEGHRLLSMPTLAMAGVVAVGAGISIIALRPMISALRGGRQDSEAENMLTV
jgi:hypothetical protein